MSRDSVGDITDFRELAFMDKLAAGAKVKAFWVDPRTGQSTAIGQFPSTGIVSFSTPAESEDALLILEASGS